MAATSSTTVVVKIGGSVLDRPETLDALAADLRALAKRKVSIVLVHGGGPQLDKALTALGEQTIRVQGLRVTSERAASVVLDELDRLGASLASALVGAGLRAEHVPAACGFFYAEPKDIDGIGRVGTVNVFDDAGLPDEFERAIPVVTPVGFDADGPLNINADEGAAAVAGALEAEWLVLATDVTHVRGANGAPLQRLDPAGVQALVAAGAARGGMLPKLDAASTALAHGVQRVLITQLAPGTLTEAILKNKPSGTIVERRLEVVQ